MSQPAIATPGTCAEGDVGSRLLPANPFYALRYHFGMLLGVQDFQDEQAYHRGKDRLHNAWLHRDGAVWGLKVSVPDLDDDGSDRGEIEVQPGLALDAAGQELFLETSMCVQVGEWFERHRDDPELDVTETTRDDGATVVTFEAHVLIRLRVCLARPVPALSEPCEGAGSETAHSRAVETVDLRLVPGAPEPGEPPPYHRLRVLFGVADPETDDEGAVVPADQEVLDARDAVLALPAEDRRQACLEAFRRFAALDEMDLRPGGDGDAQSRFFPADGTPPVLLARVTDIELVQESPDGPWQLASATVDNTVRPSHVATSTIQELLCGCCEGGSAEAPAEGEGAAPPPVDSDTGSEVVPPPPATDAGGPRVLPDSVEVHGERIAFQVTGSLSKNSIEDPRAVTVSSFDRVDGWSISDVRSVAYDRDAHQVTVELRSAPEGSLVRIIVHGTGPNPVLNTEMTPLAGAVGGPAGGASDGNDFVSMLRQGG